jgi:hypothetical protein
VGRCPVLVWNRAFARHPEHGPLDSAFHDRLARRDEQPLLIGRAACRLPAAGHASPDTSLSRGIDGRQHGGRAARRHSTP